MLSHCISVRQSLLKCLKVRSIAFGTINKITNCNKLVLHNSLEKNFTYTHLYVLYSIWQTYEEIHK